jgi:hypothetical protein
LEVATNPSSFPKFSREATIVNKNSYLLEAEIVKDWDNPDSPLAKRPTKDRLNAVLAHGHMGFQNLGGARTIGLKVKITFWPFGHI